MALKKPGWLERYMKDEGRGTPNQMTVVPGLLDAPFHVLNQDGIDSPLDGKNIDMRGLRISAGACGQSQQQ